MRHGILFRSDSLHAATDDDVAIMDALGLRLVMDLRSDHEIELRGRFPFESTGIGWCHLPILDETWNRDEMIRNWAGPTPFLTRAYDRMLIDGAPRFAAAIKLLAEVDATPAVFHCAVGKDRTGLLAALLLGALGVQPAHIVHDFALTGAAMPAIVEALQQRHPERRAEFATLPPGFFDTPPDAMEATLALIDRRHGSLMGLLHEIGVGDDIVSTLRDRLLVGVA